MKRRKERLVMLIEFDLEYESAEARKEIINELKHPERGVGFGVFLADGYAKNTKAKPKIMRPLKYDIQCDDSERSRFYRVDLICGSTTYRGDTPWHNYSDAKRAATLTGAKPINEGERK